jgi:hypothetical protein
VDGCYVGRVAVDDPLHPMLCRVADEGMGVARVGSFDAFRLNGSNEVYGYEERGSGIKLVCKFFGGRFGWDRLRAAWTADREYHCYKMLRRYALVGSPHHVIRPLALEPGINCALVLEYYGGEQLSRAIDGAIHADDEARLYERLTALGYYLATQHNRTANGGARRFHRRLRLPRRPARHVAQDRPDRAVGRRRAPVAVEPLADARADVGRPAGVAAR